MSSLRKSVERLAKLQAKIPKERQALSATRKCIGPNQIVEYQKDSWTVQSEGYQSSSLLYITQEEAIAQAKRIANAQNSEVVIYDRDGRVLIQD